jgi:putative ABC transport system substrate-binding protein
MPFKPGDSEGETLAAALRQGLQELDWSEGRIALEFRWSTGDVAQARAYATELVALSPEVIFAFTAGQLSAVARETKTIPLIFVGVSDAVGSGFVASFARPGGNITGFTLFEASLGGKWFEVLREVTPRLARASIMMNPETATGRGVFYVKSFEIAAAAFSVQAATAPVRSVDEIKAAIGSLGEQSDSGLVVVPDTFTEAHRELIVTLAARHRVPTVYPFRHFAMNGGLMSYSPDTSDAFRRAAGYLDRILKGDKPAHLPVQVPTKYQLTSQSKRRSRPRAHDPANDPRSRR